MPATPFPISSIAFVMRIFFSLKKRGERNERTGETREKESCVCTIRARIDQVCEKPTCKRVARTRIASKVGLTSPSTMDTRPPSCLTVNQRINRSCYSLSAIENVTEVSDTMSRLVYYLQKQ